MDDTRKIALAVLAVALIVVSVGVAYGLITNARAPINSGVYSNSAPYNNHGPYGSYGSYGNPSYYGAQGGRMMGGGMMGGGFDGFRMMG